MAKPFRLMKGADFQLKMLRFPYLASPKIDGNRSFQAPHPDDPRRCQPVSPSLKVYPNLYVQRILSHPILSGLDGELVVGPANAPDVINRCGELRRIEGEPDFTLHAFDVFDATHPLVPYELRQQWLWERVAEINRRAHTDPVMAEIAKRVKPIYQTPINNMRELDDYEATCLRHGFEGVMLRSPFGPYKFGRATAREGWLLKVKRFEDSEGILVRVEAAMENLNPKEVNALGLSERSTRKDGKVPKEMIGRLVLRELDGKGTGPDGKCLEFPVGPGKMTHADRIALWAVRDTLPGALVKFKHFPHGRKDLPRHGSFLCFRHPDDM